MIYDKAADQYVLRSGRRFHAVSRIIGIGEDPTDGEFTSGHDDAVIVDGRNFDITDDEADRRRFAAWTPEERAELAGEMIRRWLRFMEGV